MEVLAQLQHFKDALNASLQEEFNALLEMLKEQKQSEKVNEEQTQKEQTQNALNSNTQQKKHKAKMPKQKRHFIDIVSFEY